jgi:hypothetical protein
VRAQADTNGKAETGSARETENMDQSDEHTAGRDRQRQERKARRVACDMRPDKYSEEQRRREPAKPAK